MRGMQTLRDTYNRKTDVTRYETSAEELNSSAIKLAAVDGAEDAKVLSDHPYEDFCERSYG